MEVEPIQQVKRRYFYVGFTILVSCILVWAAYFRDFLLFFNFNSKLKGRNLKDKICGPIKINIIKTSSSSSSIATQSSNNEHNDDQMASNGTISQSTSTYRQHRHNSLDMTRSLHDSKNDIGKNDLLHDDALSSSYQLRTNLSNHQYDPIRDTDNDHNITYIPLDDAGLDYHLLQSFHNGFTFCICLNEYDLIQTNYLLNLRLGNSARP
jgi:hypothetical protein